MRIRSLCLALLVGIIGCGTLAAQEALLRLSLPDRIRISERTNLSRRDDGRYIGLRNRQVTGYLTRSVAENSEGGRFAGRFLIFEQTRRDMAQVGRPVEQSVDATVEIGLRAGFTRAGRFPTYRRIPTLPIGPVRPGSSWEAPAELLIELPSGAPPLILPVQVSYRYAGTEPFDGQTVHRIDAQFATRYPLPPPEDESSEDVPPPVPPRPDVRRIAGRHQLTILLPAEPGRTPLFIRDELEEQYELAGAPTTLFRGHTLLFVHGLSIAGQEEIAGAVRQQLETRMPGVDIDDTTMGTRLTIRNIQFVADQAVILPEDQGRLEEIARSLATLNDVRFLVVGHTADVGMPEGQARLSLERAQAVVREFIRRGLEPGLFDVEGRGGSEPVATNATEEGRARNRRVEIIILEQ